MATMTRITWRWDGWFGAPGYSNFYVRGTLFGTTLDAAAAALKTFLATQPALFPTNVVLTCLPTATQMNDTDGTLLAPIAIPTVPAVVSGTGGTTFSGTSGMVVCWRTARLVVRRLMVGRTFLVPIGSSSYDNQGTLNDSTKTTMTTAANTYVNRVGTGSDGRPVVWHRNQKFQSDGFSADAISATINDQASVLTSRRN